MQANCNNLVGLHETSGERILLDNVDIRNCSPIINFSHTGSPI
jgi:hypothetical protein